jgi:hypothetical protein
VKGIRRMGMGVFFFFLEEMGMGGGVPCGRCF